MILYIELIDQTWSRSLNKPAAAYRINPPQEHRPKSNRISIRKQKLVSPKLDQLGNVPHQIPGSESLDTIVPEASTSRSNGDDSRIRGFLSNSGSITVSRHWTSEEESDSEHSKANKSESHYWVLSSSSVQNSSNGPEESASSDDDMPDFQ